MNIIAIVRFVKLPNGKIGVVKSASPTPRSLYQVICRTQYCNYCSWQRASAQSS